MKRLFSALLILTLLLTSVAAGAIATPRTIPVLAREDIPATPHGIHNYLLLCVDSWNGKANNLGNTDGMVLVTADEDMGKISLTSFTRDLLVKNPEKSGYNRLSRYVINNGADKEAVEKLVGIFETHFGVRIDHYIVVDWTMIQNIIDACGGVDITITDGEATRLRSKTAYTTSWTEPVLPSKNGGGTYHFKGHSAVIYMRIRSSYVVNGEANDFRRTTRARMVLSSLADSLRDITYDKALDLLDAVVENTLVTDMSAADLFEAVQIAFSLKGTPIDQLRIPIKGTFEEIDYGGSAQQIDYPANREALHAFLYGTFIVRDQDEEPDEEESAAEAVDPAEQELSREMFDVPHDGTAYSDFLSAYNNFLVRSAQTDYSESADLSEEFEKLMAAYTAFLSEYEAFEKELTDSKTPLLMMSKQKEMEERYQTVQTVLDRLDQMELNRADEEYYVRTLETILENIETNPSEGQ